MTDQVPQNDQKQHYHIVRIWPQTGELDIVCIDHAPTANAIELQAPLYVVAQPIPRIAYEQCTFDAQAIHRISYQNITEKHHD